jgi:pimeloyl-ACP methyl ester carboxylesterase
LQHDSVHLLAAGFDLHADVWDGGGEPPVLLLHGLGGNTVTWHGVGPILAKRLRARVLALDLPGFGASHPRGKPLGFRVLTEVVRDVLTHEAPAGQSFWIAGNSLGGMLALEAASRLPERVRGVTLAAASLPLAWGRSPREFLALASYLSTAAPWVGRRLVARYMRSTGLPGVVDDPIRWLFGDAARLDAEHRRRLLDVSGFRLTWVSEAARALEQVTRGLGLALLRPDCAARWIRAVRCPVQSLHGTRDPLYPPGAWAHLARLRPEWDHVCLDDIGHVPQLEAPAVFAEHMLRFEGTW